MRLARRALLALLAAPGVALGAPVAVPRTLVFPRDHGAHPEFRTEWWYVTGWLDADDGDRCGFQLTFFRSRTDLAAGNPSRFAARQLLFAHAALSDLRARRFEHGERIARWNGDADARAAAAGSDDTRVHVGDWRLERNASDGSFRATFGADRFGCSLTLAPTQPLLLQGDAGFSRKGPDAAQASHYTSQPQLDATGTLRRGARTQAVRGRAWLDHEWSEALLHPDAVGWDWVGMNLDDGGALTAFRLRRADGSTLWAGGSWRERGDAPVRAFARAEVRFVPGRRWTSPRSGAAYPVEWALHTPAGAHRIAALLDDQELDSRGSTGAIYWEGLSELRVLATNQRIGLGYLEMTGVAAPLKLGG